MKPSFARARLSLPLASLLASLVALASFTPASARADDDAKKVAAPPSEEASQRFRSGVAFYKDKDFAAALVEFKRAYELVPNYSVLYNLGQTGRELKDYAAALEAFEQYLDEGGARVAPARHKEVAAAIVEEGEVHVSEALDDRSETGAVGNALGGGGRGAIKALMQCAEPGRGLCGTG